MTTINNHYNILPYSISRLLLLIFVFVICSQQLKHPNNAKNKSKQTQQNKTSAGDKTTITTTPTPSSTITPTSVTPISSSTTPSVSSPVVATTSSTSVSQSQIKPHQIQPIQVKPLAVPPKEQAKGPILMSMSQTHSFLIEPSQNQFVIPVTVGEKNYSLGIIYDVKSSKYGQLPSWFFTNATDTKQGHQLCDRNNDCQNITKLIQCQPKNSKVQNPACIEQGKAKYNQQTIKSKKQFKIQFTNNNNKYQAVFVSPYKVSLTDHKIGQQEIQGMINLALNAQQQYEHCAILNHNNLTILSEKQLEQHINKDSKESKDEFLELSKGGLLGLSSQKDIFIRTQHVKTKQQTNNVKGSYKKIHLHFTQNKFLMALSKNLLTAIKNILKKQYFGDRCKIDDDQIVCSADPVKNITQIKLCRDKAGKKCMNLNILGRIIKQQKANRKYRLLIKQNKEKDQEQTIVFYPKLAEVFEIYVDKGVVKGAKYLTDTKQAEASTTKQQQSHVQKKNKQKQDEQQNSDQSQAKKNVKEQEESQDQQIQTKKSKKQEQDSQQKQEQESQKNNKNSKKKQKSKKLKHQTQASVNSQKGAIEQQQSYSKKRLFFVFLYCSAFVVIIIAIKVEAKQSFAAALIDRFLQVTWYRMINNFFQKNQGYNAPNLQQEEPHEQLDRSDSVAVGISGKQGKELFWQRNSIQGF